MSLIGAIVRRLFGGPGAAHDTGADNGQQLDVATSGSDWFVSDEEREQERIIEQVCERLEAGVQRVDVKRRRLIWKPDRRALTLEASIRRLRTRLPECDPDELAEAVLYWIEQIALPENVTEEQMERHEARIERWIEAYHERADGA